MTVRTATPDDLDTLVDMLWDVAAEGQWLGVEIPFDTAARRDRFATALEVATSTVLVAVADPDGKPIIGHILVRIEPYGVADVGMLIADGWRGRGVGTALLDAACAWAREAGAHKVALEVWPHNTAAIALYTRSGFVTEGRRLRHYRRRNGQLWDSVLMGKPLRPEPA